MDTITASDLDRHGSRPGGFRGAVIFAASNDEDAVAAETEGYQGSRTLFAHVPVDRHVVFGTVEQAYAGFRADVGEKCPYEVGEVGGERGGGLSRGVGSRGPVVLGAEGEPAEFGGEELG